MILIEENFSGIITEASAEGKKTYLSGVFMEAGIKNRNGRVYSLTEMAAQVKRFTEANQLGQPMLGELDHPNSLEVKLENVSHRIVELKMQGNQVYGKAEVLDKHPKGMILKSLMDHQIRVGVSSRASGQLNESTGEVKNFSLVTIDAVATPSCRSAYPETIQEQLEFYRRGEIVTDLAESVIHDIAAQKYFQEEMRKFIDSIYN